MKTLGSSSKLNSEWAFLIHLRDIGRRAAKTWIVLHFDGIGERSAIDLRSMFGETGLRHHGRQGDQKTLAWWGSRSNAQSEPF